MSPANFWTGIGVLAIVLVIYFSQASGDGAASQSRTTTSTTAFAEPITPVRTVVAPQRQAPTVVPTPKVTVTNQDGDTFLIPPGAWQTVDLEVRVGTQADLAWQITNETGGPSAADVLITGPDGELVNQWFRSVQGDHLIRTTACTHAEAARIALPAGLYTVRFENSDSLAAALVTLTGVWWYEDC